MAISFSIETEGFSLKQRNDLKNWIKKTTAIHKKQCGNIHYVFVNDDRLLEMNQQFLNHNTFTDIITFDYSEGNNIHGDIFISIDRVRENAKKFETSFNNELHRVMIHGVLHLCGLKDKSKADAERMRQEENRSLGIRHF
jgi:probable rRNA maturation factor